MSPPKRASMGPSEEAEERRLQVGGPSGAGSARPVAARKTASKKKSAKKAAKKASKKAGKKKASKKAGKKKAARKTAAKGAAPRSSGEAHQVLTWEDRTLTLPEAPPQKGSLFPVPRYVIWELTREYDDENVLSRQHQAPPEGGHEKATLSTDEAVAVIDNIAKVGNTILIFSGGEPLLRKDIFELARYAKTKGLKVILNTQGHLFDANAARECVMAGIKAVQVGLDGSSARSHDGFRKAPGSFVKAIKGIELMRLAGLRFEVNSLITRDNVEEIPKIQSLAQKLGAKGHNVMLVIPTGRYAAFQGSELTGEEYEEWLHRLFEQKYRQKMNMKLVAQPLFHKIIYERGDELSDSQDPNRSKEAAEALGPACPAARVSCYVSVDGEVFASPHLVHSVGNIRERDFKGMWQKSPLFNYLRSRDCAVDCMTDKALKRVMQGCGCPTLDALAESTEV